MTVPTASTAAQAVLADSNLLCNIYEHLESDMHSITSARVVSSVFEDAVSPFLFRTLKIAMRKASLTRLEYVAATAKFAKGVRTLVYETIHYGTSGQNSVDQAKGYTIKKLKAGIKDYIFRCHASELALPFDDIMQTLVLQHVTLQYEEQELMRYSNTFSGRLEQAFTKLTGLRDVVCTPLVAVYDTGKDAPFTTKIYQRMPPLPILAFRDPATCSQEQSRRFTYLLAALASSGRHIRSFRIMSSPKVDLSPTVARHYTVPGLSLDFAQLARDPNVIISSSEGLSRVKELEIDMSSIDHPNSSVPQTHSLNSNCAALAPFLNIFWVLEVLNVRLCAQYRVENITLRIAPTLQQIFANKIYTRLRKVVIREMWFMPEDLVGFLHRHEQTLQIIELVGINLGGCKPHAGQRLFTVGHMLSMMHGQESLEWEQVAVACKFMPKLRGLRIEGASVGKEWCALGVHDMLEVEEAGMDGRENCFAALGLAEMFDEE
ncbi:hypothetical protein LTR86_006054 [Recurvomyces mirabilis]|nr:hypothetical protein LTR86_006054 [Recurvomyces mirabilis]